MHHQEEDQAGSANTTEEECGVDCEWCADSNSRTREYTEEELAELDRLLDEFFAGNEEPLRKWFKPVD